MMRKRLIGSLSAVWLVAGTGLSAECKGPPALEARARTARDGSGLSDLGTWFGQHGNFACATPAFRASLQLNSKSAKVQYFLGLSLASSGHAEEAVMPLRRSEELDLKAVQPRLLLAAVLDGLQREGEAEAEWKSLLRIDPHSEEALLGLSNEQLARREYGEVIALLAPVKLNEVLTLNLVSAYGESGMLEEAGAVAREALTAKPESLQLTKALATVYVHQQRYQDARGVLERYFERHPGDQASEIEYLSVLVLTNDTATARPLGKKLLTAAPHDFSVLSLNGILEREAEEYGPAREHLQEAVTLQPKDYTARYNLGATLAHLGQLKEAKAQLETAIALDATQPDAHFQLAGVLRTLQDAAGAQVQLALYEKLKRDSAGQAEAQSKAEQAKQSLAAGNVAHAAALYREAVAASPENPLLQYQYALALNQTGDLVNERKALEAALRLDSTFALAANQLGYLDTQNGDNSAAERNFRTAIKAAPEFTGAWVNLAAALASQSRFPEAKEAVETALKLEPQNASAIELKKQLALQGNP